MKLSKIENITLRERVYEILREKIITAEIRPGEKLTLRGIACQLGVSLIPVREALFRLESEKAVEIVSNKHIQVKKLSRSEIEEIYRIRIALESMAVERACDHVSPSGLSTIKEKLSKMQKATKNANYYLTHNRDFHFAFYRMAESPILIELITNLWARTGPYLHIHFTSRSDVSINMEYHLSMYEALVNRDRKKLVHALCQDMEIAAQDILSSTAALSSFSEFFKFTR
jgi:DNA-binding GntR family transcriptional regulator